MSKLKTLYSFNSPEVVAAHNYGKLPTLEKILEKSQLSREALEKPPPVKNQNIGSLLNLPYFQCIGNTPLLKISDKIYAKLETFNPSGSIKDRMVGGILKKAIKMGEIHEDTILIEATSGNTGVALSAAGAALGLPVEIYMPCNMSEARKQMIRAFGATLHEVGANDFHAAIRQRDERLKEKPGIFWSPRQFDNKENREIHYRTTAVEVARQLKEEGVKWAAFIQGSGTGGTISGFCKYKRKNHLNFDIVMTEPTECPDHHGIQGIFDGADFLMNRDEIDVIMKVRTAEAKERAAEFAHSHGILVGISSGANLVNAEHYVKTINPEGVVVCILCDRGERYMDIFDTSSME